MSRCLVKNCGGTALYRNPLHSRGQSGYCSAHKHLAVANTTLLKDRSEKSALFLDYSEEYVKKAIDDEENER